MIVMENPTQVTIVSAVPLDSTGAFCATSVENSGESAITAMPQMIRNEISIHSEEIKNITGEIAQQIPDMLNAIAAIFFAPYFWER